MSSKIEWTEDTLNPLIGCDKVSAGCKNCYAIKTAWIRQHNQKMAEKYAGVVEKTSNGSLNWTGKINMHYPSLEKPFRKSKPTMYFVNSMSDLFHKDVPMLFIADVFAMMWLTERHTYQVLTKRIDRAAEILNSDEFKEALTDACNRLHHEFIKPLEQAVYFHDEVMADYPLPNVWIGTSVEDQKAADERIPFLLQIPAAVRFLSCEPLLGPVNIKPYLRSEGECDTCNGCGSIPANDKNTFEEGGGGVMCPDCLHENRLQMGPSLIHWVIVGGESGKDARPIHPEWARSLRDQCKEAEVPFFFKQWGEWYTRWADLRDKSDHPYVFKYYDSYQQFTQKDWVNKGDACISVDGRICKRGGDFMECAYPVAIMQKVGKKKAGRLLDGKEYGEFPNSIFLNEVTK